METETPQVKTLVGNTPMPKAEYDRRMRKLNRNVIFGLVANFALGTGNPIYQINRSPPPAPKGYSTLVDARTTLDSLVDREHSLNETLMLNTPYVTEATNKALEGYPNSNAQDLKRLADAIFIVNGDITQMEAQNPEFGVYEKNRDSFANRVMLYSVGGVALSLAGLCGFAASLDQRRTRLTREYNASIGAQK